VWQQSAGSCYSGDTTTAVLALINLGRERNGKDFALDDMALAVSPKVSNLFMEFDDEEPPTPVPGPGSTLLLLGGGLTGLAGLQRPLKSRLSQTHA
jgi:hypothetical protein